MELSRTFSFSFIFVSHFCFFFFLHVSVRHTGELPLLMSATGKALGVADYGDMLYSSNNDAFFPFV